MTDLRGLHELRLHQSVVTHLADAIGIIDDSRIEARLVYDEGSRLHTTRTSVVWLSPNPWNGANGCYFGSTSFEFDWTDIIKDRQLYWVENARPSKLPTYRFLVTDGDAPQEKLQRFFFRVYTGLILGAMERRSAPGEPLKSADFLAEGEGDKPSVPFHLCFAKIHPKVARFSCGILAISAPEN